MQRRGWWCAATENNGANSKNWRGHWASPPMSSSWEPLRCGSGIPCLSCVLSCRALRAFRYCRARGHGRRASYRRTKRRDSRNLELGEWPALSRVESSRAEQSDGHWLAMIGLREINGRGEPENSGRKILRQAVSFASLYQAYGIDSIAPQHGGSSA